MSINDWETKYRNRSGVLNIERNTVRLEEKLTKNIFSAIINYSALALLGIVIGFTIMGTMPFVYAILGAIHVK